MTKQIKQIGFISLIGLIGFIWHINLAQAQTIAPQFLISWQSRNYAPPWYQGKVLATRGSFVSVSFDLFENGKQVDFSKSRVRWYVNDDLRRNEQDGLGIKNYSFKISDYANDDIEVRIVIADDGKEQIGDRVIIPLVSPEAVIDAPYPGRQLPNGASTFTAYPFFFTSGLEKLSFNWSVNGRQAERNIERQNVLKLNIDRLAPSGFGIDVQTTINNLMDELELAGSRLKMEVK